MASSGGDASLLRKLNSVAVLKALHQARIDSREAAGATDASAALSVTEIAAACGVSRPTAEDVAVSLLEQGWVEEELPDPSKPRTAGRPARRFRFRAGAGYVLGIDVGSHSVLALVADLLGTVVSSYESAVQPTADARQRVDVVGHVVTESLRKAGVQSDLLLATAAGTTGIVDAAGRIVLGNVWPGWTGLDLAAALGRFVPTPVTVQNDIRLGAVAERWRGAAQGADDVVYIHAGMRMGSGFLIEGRPHRGFRGAAGELSYASSRRWVRAYNRLLEAGSPPDKQGGTVESGPVIAGDAGPVFDAAAAGDTAARRTVETFAQELIKGVEALVVTIDPEVVVIGGSLSRAGDFVAEPISRHLAKACVLGAPRVAVSPLGEDSVALGAVRVALDQVEARLFTESQTTNASHRRI